MRYVGIDAHKKFVYVAELHEDGSLKEYRVDLGGEGLAKLRTSLGKDAHVVLEASTGTFRLYDELVTHAGEVTVAHPYQTRGATAFHSKTDRRDAVCLARLRKAGFVQGVWVPDREFRCLRSLTELRRQLAKARQAAMLRIKSMLAQEMLTAPLGCLSGTLGKRYLQGLVLGHPHLDACLRSQVAVFDTLDCEIKKVEDQLKAWCATSEDAQLLLTIPGVGPVVATSLIAQIGDVNRFPTASKLCAYAGIVPRVHQSGATLRIGRISHAGRPLMRWALSIAVPHVAHRPGPLQDFHTRLTARRPKVVVHTACARKLLAVIWYMLKKRIPYATQDKALSQRKQKALLGVDKPRRKYGVGVRPRNGRRTIIAPAADPDNVGSGIQDRNRGRPGR